MDISATGSVSDELFGTHDTLTGCFGERRLEKIGEGLDDGSRRAFGPRRDHIISLMGDIRTMQKDIFRKHMDLELTFPVVNQGENFNSEDFCEGFRSSFKEKESEMEDIGERLLEVGKKLEAVNRDVAAGLKSRDAAFPSRSSHRMKDVAQLIRQRNRQRKMRLADIVAAAHFTGSRASSDTSLQQEANDATSPSEVVEASDENKCSDENHC